MASGGSAASAVEDQTSVGGPSGVSAELSSSHLPGCTQPGCAGTILDGYCDVCGSPADAFTFDPAAALEASSASAAEDQTSVRGPSGVSPEPGNGHLPGCRQPGCTGTIVDGYCDVCGSPSDAVAIVSATALAASPAEGTGNVDGWDELTAGESGGHNYRMRVEKASLPDDVREAALCEVDKLELTRAQSPESHEIAIWLDTILNLPWTTNITESINLQDSREVETTLRRLIQPTVADVETDDTVGIEPFVIDVEERNAAGVGPPAADVVKVDAAEAKDRDVDVEEGDAGEAEPAVVAEVEKDAARVEPLAVDVVQVDATEAEPPAV
ncbi:MAG: hypothetical protein ACJ72M_20175, partial [Propionibacteriaceae bacterium]